MTWNIYHLEAPTEVSLLNALTDMIPTAEGITHKLGTQDVGGNVVVVAFQVGYRDWEYDDADGNITKQQTMGRYVADIAVDADWSSLDLSELDADNGWKTKSQPPHAHAVANFGATSKNRRNKGVVDVLESIAVPRHSF